MPQRTLRVLKWLSTTPQSESARRSSKEFKVPMSALTRTKDAQENPQQQFDGHKCEQNEKS
jgi:hypothetical protein